MLKRIRIGLGALGGGLMLLSLMVFPLSFVAGPLLYHLAGATADGVVITRNHLGRDASWVEIRFTTATGTAVVTRKEGNRAFDVSEPPPIGASVKIRYLPILPGVFNSLEGEPDLGPGAAGFLLAPVLFVAGMVLFAIRGALRRPRRLVALAAVLLLPAGAVGLSALTGNRAFLGVAVVLGLCGLIFSIWSANSKPPRMAFVRCVQCGLWYEDSRGFRVYDQTPVRHVRQDTPGPQALSSSLRTRSFFVGVCPDCSNQAGMHGLRYSG
jgi:hypothetical protein